MQVAKKTMCVSSIVIGIDLFPIKPIAGCISLKGDITTDECRKELSKNLGDWKVDVVLNDGAPNVGRNWLFDAYQQICLSLSAVKLASEFLQRKGWFVTKVFRSKDYNAFVWVLKQLFDKVYATKPSASRKESAEIFIVCQGYKAPSKIDPNFFDPKYVFEELEIEPANKIDLLKEPKTIKKAKAVGYESIDLRRIVTASEFLKAESALDVLQVATEIKIDEPRIEKHAATTAEIQECFKDIKVLGRKDLKEIIKWWKRLKEQFYPKEVADEEPSTSEQPKEVTEEEQEEIEIDEMEKYIQDLKVEEEKDEKRKKKKANKERSKLDQKLALKMVIKGDSGPQETQDENIFNLREIKDKKVLEKLVDGADVTKKRDRKKKAQSKMVAYDEDELHDEEVHIPTITSDVEDDSDEVEEELGLDKPSDDEGDDNWNLRSTPKNGVPESARKGGASERNRNPLLTDLDYRDKDSKRVQKAQLWFEKDAFKNMSKTEDGDQDLDLDNMVKNLKKKGIEVIGESDKPDLSKLGKKARRRARHQDEKNAESSSDSEDEKQAPAPPSDNEDDAQPKVKKIKLREEELALGQMMITSRKTKRDLIDGAWNRFMFNDDNLPDWFVEDEKKSMQRVLPVSEELVDNYRKNLTEFNTRSIKKVMEAKARKKRQNKKKMEKITKKAANIMENADHTSQEKARMLKKLYKKAEKKKQEVTYVVAKKTGISGKRVRRPAGVQGRFKVVDPRLKKDMRGEQKAQKSKRGKASSKGGKGARGKVGKQQAKGGRSAGKGKAGGKQKRK